MEVPILNAVRTLSGPGKSALTTAAAVMAPRICVMVRRTPRMYGNAPTRHIPSVTAGLKRPPEMRKKTQALTAREKPKDRLMYRSWAGLEACAMVMDVCGAVWVFATCVPEKAKKRKRKVPMNSPHMATK